MANGAKELAKQIARLQSLQTLVVDSVPDVAKALKKESTKQLNKGTAPNGKPWRKKLDGKDPLLNAANAVKVTTVGTVIVMRLDGHYARHHLGAVKGKKQRRILPTGNLPDPMTRAVKEVVDQAFADTMEIPSR